MVMRNKMERREVDRVKLIEKSPKAPKGRNIIARGNALGHRYALILSPERAT
jgi:hypothetical protein